MSRGKGILYAAAPITALLVLAAGARFLPSVMGKNPPNEDEAVPVLLPEKAPASQGGKAPVRPRSAPEKPADAKTQTAIQKVVSGQLDAFAKEDFASALNYSAPQFQQTNSPESFRQMIKMGYAPLLGNNTVRFAPARCSADRAMIPTFVKAAGGNELGYLYIMRKASPEESGGKAVVWYIEGVARIEPKGFPGAPGPGRVTDVRDI